MFPLLALGTFEGVGENEGIKGQKHRTLDSLLPVTATQRLVLGASMQ